MTYAAFDRSWCSLNATPFVILGMDLSPPALYYLFFLLSLSHALCFSFASLFFLLSLSHALCLSFASLFFLLSLSHALCFSFASLFFLLSLSHALCLSFASLFLLGLTAFVFLDFSRSFCFSLRIWEKWDICNIPPTLIRRFECWPWWLWSPNFKIS